MATQGIKPWKPLLFLMLLSAAWGMTALRAAEKVLPPAPLNPRKVVCPHDGILTVNTALSQTTEIEVPPGQYLYDIKGGDQNTWDITASTEANPKEPPRSVGVMPKIKGATTMLYLTTNSQQQCVLRLQEVTGQASGFDSVLRMQRADGKTETLLSEVKWVPAYQVQESAKQAEEARQEREAALASVPKKIEEGIEAYRAQVPYEMKHPFVYNVARAEKLGVHGIYWLGHMTVIEGEFPNAPVPYELFEGKPKQINFSLHKGVYITDKRLTSFYLVLGAKKEHRLDVRLRGDQ
jgi:Conjugal transfer protein